MVIRDNITNYVISITRQTIITGLPMMSANSPTADNPQSQCTQQNTPYSREESARYVVEEEYTVGIPLIRPSVPFLAILKKAGATGEVFTKKEICYFLKTYIGSRLMYDATDPRIVYCDKDPLGEVFGVGKFTITEVVDLIVKNCTPVPDTCIKRRRHLVSKPLNTSPQSKQDSTTNDCKQVPADASTSSSLRIEVCSAAVVSSSVPPSSTLSKITTQTSNVDNNNVPITVKENPGVTRKNSEKNSDSSDTPSRKRKSSVSIVYNEKETSMYPWYFQLKMAKDEESEVLSVQSKSTVPVEDSTDDLWFVEEDTISVQYESDAYELEYELTSDVTVIDSDSDDVNSDIAVADVLVLCRDSDKEFWADSSGIDSDTDTEFTDADKWLCECSTKNLPIQRYCCRCWKLRPSWLPEEIANLPDTAMLSQQPRSASSSECSETVIQEKETPKELCEPKLLSESTDIKNKQNSDRNKRFRKKLKRQNSKTTSTPLTSEKEVSIPSTEQAILKSIDSGICMSQSSNQETAEPSSSFMSSSACEMSKSLPNLGARTTLSNFRNKSPEPTYSKHLAAPVDSSTSSSVESPCKNSPTKKLKLENWAEKLANPAASASDLCAICMVKPKTGSIIHGSSGHQIACYKCAKTLKKQGKSCPVCRRTIQKVVKNYLL